MTNRDDIKSVLDELGIIYKMDINVMNNDITIDTYFINFVVDNHIISGGILDGGASDDKHISILFFIDTSNIFENNENNCLKIINRFNQDCKYGNFFVDDDNDIVYSLAVPAIESDHVERKVFKFYFSSVLSIIADSIKEIIHG